MNLYFPFEYGWSYSISLNRIAKNYELAAMLYVKRTHNSALIP